MMSAVLWPALTVILLCGSCKNPNMLFREVDGRQIGVKFRNSVDQDEIFNILTFEHLYNGGGVAIDDFNNDNWPDIFMTGNLVGNKLFLNEGGLKFKDVSDEAGIIAPGKWSSGVTVVDINGDGWRDIYVCATLYGPSDDRKNMLFINKGLNEEGIPVFEDEAGQYGIADDGHSTHAVFFDYDRDNDLDLYVLTNQLEVRSPNKFYFKREDGSAPNTDRFYRNNGDGTFTNYSKEAGITIEGYGLGINVVDLNEDGWLDIYVSNDYLTNDVLYINNGDGTFTNKISEFLKHQSHSSMGCDIADVNNDGLYDIITVEMLPFGMNRMKRAWTAGWDDKSANNEKLGYDFQYMRNMLQINQGIDPDGGIKYADMSFSSGLYASDWSWAPLFADYDADGDMDLFISNGFPKDITDLDFVSFQSQHSLAMDRKALLDALPESKVKNFFFENTGHLKFQNSTEKWGVKHKSFSNGAAYGDLDNDGDIDLVINNINDNATILINQSRGINYLKIRLDDKIGGSKAQGAKIELRIGKKLMVQHFMPQRGYLSSMQPVIIFWPRRGYFSGSSQGDLG